MFEHTFDRRDRTQTGSGDLDLDPEVPETVGPGVEIRFSEPLEAMVRRYDDPVEVRRGVLDGSGVEGPQQFLWHGRLWKVREVVAHWVETGSWWQSAGAYAVLGADDRADGRADDRADDPAGAVLSGDLLAERELWRVEAGVGPASVGVFDLSFDWSDGHWQLVGCAD